MLSLIMKVSWTNHYLSPKLVLRLPKAGSNMKLTCWSVSPTFWHTNDSFCITGAFSLSTKGIGERIGLIFISSHSDEIYEDIRGFLKTCNFPLFVCFW